VGSVKKSVYMAYFRTWGPWLLIPLLVIIGSFGDRGLQVVQSYVLTLWSNAVAAANAVGERANEGCAPRRPPA
jgi:hypothetical protein